LDLLTVKHANLMSGLTDIVITKIDVLDGLDEIKVCVGYEIDGKEYNYIPSDQADVAKAKPIYKTFKGWKKDITKMTTVDQLPQECLDYVHFIEEFTGVRVSMISVGPDRVNNIYVHEIK
ncbi:MAG: adenylosuccinate synthetase, partial [Holdemanella biformis]